MDTFWQMDWRSMLIPSVALTEVFLRGSIIYLFLFFILRLLRREAGALGISDLLVVVLIADAAQNAMSSDYKSITEGLSLVSTIAFWDYLLDYLGYRFPSVQRLLRPAPLPLVKQGRMQRRNMRREMITEEELLGQLRQHGVRSVEEVTESYLEADGRISVIKRDSQQDEGAEPKKPIQ